MNKLWSVHLERHTKVSNEGDDRILWTTNGSSIGDILRATNKKYTRYLPAIYLIRSDRCFCNFIDSVSLCLLVKILSGSLMWFDWLGEEKVLRQDLVYLTARATIVWYWSRLFYRGIEFCDKRDYNRAFGLFGGSWYPWDFCVFKRK